MWFHIQTRPSLVTSGLKTLKRHQWKCLSQCLKMRFTKPVCDFMIALTVFVSGHHGLNTFLLHLLLIGSVGGVAGQPCHRFLQSFLVAVIHVFATLGSFTRDTMAVFQGFCTAVDRRLVLPLVHPAGVLAPSAMTSVLHKESKFISGCLPTTHCPAD